MPHTTQVSGLLESPHASYGAVPTPVAKEEDSNYRSRQTCTLYDFFGRNKGLFIIAISQLFFSLMDLGVKYLAELDEPISTLEVIAARMGITYICGQVYMVVAGVPDPFLGPKGLRGMLVFRGVAGFFGLFGLYYSLQYMTLSEATVLTFLTPAFTAVFGYLFLHEAVSWKQGVAGLFSLFGVILIAKPPFLFGLDEHIGTGVHGNPVVNEAQRMVAVCVALVGVLGASCAWVSIRSIGRRAHPMHIMSYFSLWCVFVSWVGMAATGTKWVMPKQWSWVGILLMVGIFGFLAQFLLTVGLQLEAASRGSMAMYVQIVFSLILERIAFGVSPSRLSVLGTCVIMASAIYVALNKPSTKTPASDLLFAEEGRVSFEGAGSEGEDATIA